VSASQFWSDAGDGWISALGTGRQRRTSGAGLGESEKGQHRVMALGAKKRRDAAPRRSKKWLSVIGKIMPRNSGLVELHKAVDAVLLLWLYSNRAYHLLQLHVSAHMSTQYKLDEVQ